MGDDIVTTQQRLLCDSSGKEWQHLVPDLEDTIQAYVNFHFVVCDEDEEKKKDERRIPSLVKLCVPMTPEQFPLFWIELIQRRYCDTRLDIFGSWKKLHYSTYHSNNKAVPVRISLERGRVYATSFGLNEMLKRYKNDPYAMIRDRLDFQKPYTFQLAKKTRLCPTVVFAHPDWLLAQRDSSADNDEPPKTYTHLEMANLVHSLLTGGTTTTTTTRLLLRKEYTTNDDNNDYLYCSEDSL